MPRHVSAVTVCEMELWQRIQSMPALFITLGTALCMALSVTAIHYGAECDFTGLDLDSAVAKVLSKLPEDYVLYGHKYYKAFEGVETGPFKVTGLNRVRRYGTLLPHCINNTRMLQVELVSKEDTFLSIPWRACTGHEGDILIKADISRLTVLLRVESRGFGENVKLAYEGPILSSSTENTKFEITGFGYKWAEITGTLSTLIPGITRRVWNDYFLIHFQFALVKALNEAFE